MTRYSTTGRDPDSSGALRSSSDRAVVNGAGQAVSALRASVPSAWRFKDVLAILRALNAPGDLDRIQWRVKQWQRGGFIPGANGQRGHPVQYTDAMLWRVCLLNELQQLGVTPLAASQMIMGAAGLDALGIIYGVRDSRTRIIVDIDRIAQAIEARRAETSGSIHESAVGQQADAPKVSP